MKILIGLLTLCSISAFCAEGTISASIATNRENTLDLTIEGAAAQTISDQLKNNGANFNRDDFSGALVQMGVGVRCIDQHVGKPLYCYIAITGKTVD